MPPQDNPESISPAETPSVATDEKDSSKALSESHPPISGEGSVKLSVSEGASPASLTYREAVDRVARTEGVVVLIGATDTGKTTFCKTVADAALDRGRRVAIVDADSGQSEIGPPATLGLGIPETPFDRLSDLKPRALAFVGATSPPGYLLEWANGTRFLVDRGRELGADLILVDMPGLVTGPIGLRLQQGTAEAVQPSAYVLLERKRELRTIQRGLPPGPVYRPGVLTTVRRKTATVRALRRTARFAHYFRDAREWELPVDGVMLRGGLLFIGRPLRAPLLEEAQNQLRSVRLLHVEQDEDGVRVLTAGSPSKEDRDFLVQRFGKRALLLEAGRLKHLVAGLTDRRGETVAIGTIQRVDFRRRRVTVLTPWIDPGAVGGLIWGTARVTPEGKELEPLRRGEI
jgi:polynucleotide 5'-hydroxyl-kinase GRC3/NOL9